MHLRHILTRVLLAIFIAGSAAVCRAEIYPETSYKIQNRKLLSWEGPERVVDMAGDPTLARVTSIGDFAFSGTDVEEVTLPSGLRIIPIGCFENCLRLERVNLGQRVGFIREGAFARCKSLREIDIPDGLLYIGPAAFEESGIARIDLSATSCFEYGDRAFAACADLREILLAETQPINLGSDILRDCPALEAVTIPDAWHEVPAAMLAGSRKLRSAHIGGSVTHIADSAFTGCTALREVSFGVRLTSIGRDAFAGDESIRLLYFPEEVQTIGDGAFEGCTSLERIFMGRGIRDIGDAAFADCFRLQQIDLQATAPPANWPGSFTGMDRGAVTLAVPTEAESAYIRAAGWQQFNVQPLTGVDAPVYPGHEHSVLYSLDGRRVEIPMYLGDVSASSLGGFVPPGFYILCRPGMTPTKVIIR